MGSVNAAKRTVTSGRQEKTRRLNMSNGRTLSARPAAVAETKDDNRPANLQDAFLN